MIATEPVETIHLYYEQNTEPQPRRNGDVGIALVCLACFILLVWRICSIPPALETIIVPAHFLPLKRFSVREQIIPTGSKTYPATIATGMLTITNGSIIAQELPRGLLFTGKNGVEVATNTAVFVPAGSAAGYGIATVSAHVVISGRNMAPLDIDQVLGTSLYIRNLTALTGGKPGYSITFTTPQDRQKALEIARAKASRLVPQMMLDAPCTESVNGKQLVWLCQYVTYTPPVFFCVVGVEVRGKQVVVYGFSVARSQSSARK